MTARRDSEGLFGLTRRFAWLSLIGILTTAIALGALYRVESMRTIVEFGEQANVTVAKTGINALRPVITAYLRAKETGSATARIDTLPSELLGLFRASVRNTPIRRIKLYNRKGVILYSTLEHEIGSNDSENPRFQTAIEGQVRSELEYRDAFDFFHRGTDDDNLVETYVPVRESGSLRPIGVLEVYTDVGTAVRAMSRNALLIWTGIAVIMLILYSFLLYVVRWAEKIIRGQRETILERNHTLEVLSARMLHAEEAERRRVAWELHEEIAQTLSAVKTKIDALTDTDVQQPQSPRGTNHSEEILPLLQGAIGEVRALAMDLRPPELDDFGLIATTRSLCHEAEGIREPLAITTDLDVPEEEIPDLLKGIIFRIAQRTLKSLVELSGISDIRVALRKEKKQLRLLVDFDAATGDTAHCDQSASSSEKGPVAAFWESAVLSGGTFSVTYSDAGRFLYEATWNV